MTRGGSPFIRIVDTRATAWMEGGNCWADDDKLDRLFDPSAEGQRKAADEICAGCPVTAECLQHALDQRIDHGVWGGKTEHERRPMRGLKVRERAS